MLLLLMGRWARAAADLTGDRGGVVWCVCPQVLCSLGGGLRKTLGASTVTLAGGEKKENDYEVTLYAQEYVSIGLSTVVMLY